MLSTLKGKFIGTTSRAPIVDVSVVNLTVKLEMGNYEDIKVLIKLGLGTLAFKYSVRKKIKLLVITRAW